MYVHGCIYIKFFLAWNEGGGGNPATSLQQPTSLSSQYWHMGKAIVWANTCQSEQLFPTLHPYPLNISLEK